MPGQDQERIIKITVQADAAEKELKAFHSELVKTENSLVRIGAKGSNAAKKGFGQVSRASGQASIQVQQFVGQIQGGQSALLAFSQQSADFGIVVGAPLLGAISGITASLIGMAFAFGQSNIQIQDTSDLTSVLIKDFTKLTAVQQTLATAILKRDLISQNEELDKLRETARDAATALGLFTSGKDRAAEMDKLNANILVQTLLIEENKKALQDLTLTGLAGGVVDALKERTKLEQEENANITKLIVNSVKLANTYGLTARELAIYNATLAGANELAFNAINLSHDRIDALKAEEQATKDAAAALLESERQKQSLSGAFGQIAGRSGTDEQNLATQLGNDLLVVFEFSQLGIDEQIRADEIKTQLSKKYYSDLAILRKKDSVSDTLSTANSVNNFVSSLQQLNTKSDNLKRAAIISSTAVAVMETYARVPPPWGIPLALITAAVGIKQLSQVGKKSGISSGSAPTASPASPSIFAPQSTRNVQTERTSTNELLNELRSWNGSDLIPVEYARRIAESLAEVSRQGGV